MYEIYAAQTGARVTSIPAAKNFEFPVTDVLNAITRRTRFIAIANPNNPTGAFAEVADLVKIARAAPDAAVLIDEAYFEFAGETLIPRWRDVPNLFVSRTFSKAYGMAGLRIGVLMGNAEQMHMLRRASSPYNLNSVALACLPNAMADNAYIRTYVEQALEGRRQLESELEGWGVRFWPSRANFVLMHLGADCKAFIQKMRERGILVRDRSSDYGCKDCVRITVGQREHNQGLLVALREAFSEIGMREKVTP
jgi:histidinol-phosphate aminotransferase